MLDGLVLLIGLGLVFAGFGIGQSHVLAGVLAAGFGGLLLLGVAALREFRQQGLGRYERPDRQEEIRALRQEIAAMQREHTPQEK